MQVATQDRAAVARSPQSAYLISELITWLHNITQGDRDRWQHPDYVRHFASRAVQMQILAAAKGDRDQAQRRWRYLMASPNLLRESQISILAALCAVSPRHVRYCWTDSYISAPAYSRNVLGAWEIILAASHPTLLSRILDFERSLQPDTPIPGVATTVASPAHLRSLCHRLHVAAIKEQRPDTSTQAIAPAALHWRIAMATALTGRAYKRILNFGSNLDRASLKVRSIATLIYLAIMSR